MQLELVTKEIEQKRKLELENEKLQEKLNIFEATEVKETEALSSLSMKLNVISGQVRYGATRKQNTVKNLDSRTPGSPKFEFTLMHLDTYVDYLRQVEPGTESRAV